MKRNIKLPKLNTEKITGLAKKLKKNLGSTGVLILAVAILAGASLGAYTATSYVKRVVSTNSSAISFSSNIMDTYDRSNLYGEYVSVAINVNNTGAQSTMELKRFNIGNYPRGREVNFNMYNIPYVLHAELVYLDGDKVKPVKDDTELTYTENGETKTTTGAEALAAENLARYSIHYTNKDGTVTNTFAFAKNSDGEYESKITGLKLSGGELDTNYFSAYIDSEYATAIYIRISAIPTAYGTIVVPANVENYILGAILEPGTFSTDSSGWVGEYTDEHLEVITPTTVDGVTTEEVTHPTKELDSFNYSITGSGKAKITLYWDARYVEFSKWFLEEVGASTPVQLEGTNYYYVTFDVNSAEKDEYNTQVYRITEPPSTEGYSTVYQTVISSETDTTIGEETFTKAAPYVHLTYEKVD